MNNFQQFCFDARKHRISRIQNLELVPQRMQIKPYKKETTEFLIQCDHRGGKPCTQRRKLHHLCSWPLLSLQDFMTTIFFIPLSYTCIPVLTHSATFRSINLDFLFSYLHMVSFVSQIKNLFPNSEEYLACCVSDALNHTTWWPLTTCATKKRCNQYQYCTKHHMTQ